jgi:long-chain acyl-CoA synthetase
VLRETLLDFFNNVARARGEFLVYDNGFRSRSHTYDEVGRAAYGFAARLHALGLRKGDKVVFWSENRPEWIVAFWGCLLRGVVVVPIDYRASADFLERVSRIVSASLVVIGQDVPPLGPAVTAPVWKLHELSWQELGSASAAPAVAVGRDDVAEIIFTSGATADPKGVLITHRNVLANIVPVEREVRKYRRWSRPFAPIRFLNLLPLSHMFGQAMATFIPPMLPGVVVFMRGYNPVEIVDQIKKRRISVLVSVPKILDVLREHVLRVTRHPDIPGPRQHFLRRWWRYRAVHRLFGWKFWAFVVGAAPLDGELEAVWSELGYVVVQGYGLTETAPIVSLNHPFRTRKGSVGKAMAGVEVKIAPDGEILVRGENVTRGYFNDAAETARAFEDGWFHTGDIGQIDADGYLTITDRKKDLLVTSGGKKIAPQPIEGVLKRSPLIAEAVLLGDRRKYAAVLIVPEFRALERRLQDLGRPPGTREELVAREDVIALYQEIVDALNRELSQYERIKRIALLPQEFTVESGALTPTLKVKRKVVEENWKTQIEALYRE